MVRTGSSVRFWLWAPQFKFNYINLSAPPEASITEPVTKPLHSEHKKHAIWAISIGFPNLPTGVNSSPSCLIITSSSKFAKSFLVDLDIFHLLMTY